jgi:hypothetical protein
VGVASTPSFAGQSAVNIASDPIKRGGHVGNVRCRGDVELGVLGAHGNRCHAALGVAGQATHLGEETERVVATAARDSALTSSIRETAFFSGISSNILSAGARRTILA